MNSYISRLSEAKLIEAYQEPKVLILLGARQVGKTTLLKHVFTGESVLFLNLDVGIDKQRLLTTSTLSPAEVLRSLNSPSLLVIDEAQRLPEIGRIVKGWYDSGVAAKIILSGSSSLDLLDKSAESLTGRNIKLFLPPLTFDEILKNQTWYSDIYSAKELGQFKNQIDSVLLSALVYGSYPETIGTNDKYQYLNNLVSDYLLKDVLQSGLVKTPELVQKLLSLLAFQSGSVFSVNELAQNLNLSRVTVDKYLDLLERSYVIFRLPCYSTNPRKEIAKSQKIYFWDTGIRNTLIGELNPSFLRSDIGSLWENWVVSEFAKQNLINGSTSKLYFWRSRAGAEIDLVVKDVIGNLKAYEIKWSKTKVSKSFSSVYKIPVSIINKDNYISKVMPTGGLG